MPLYALYGDVASLVQQDIDAERILAGKTGFCNFVFSNRKCKTRIKFFEKLSKYKRMRFRRPFDEQHRRPGKEQARIHQSL